jgi:hypothetical protein
VAPTSGLTIISQQSVDGDTYYRYSDGNNYLVDRSGAVYNLSQGGAYQVAGLPAATAAAAEPVAQPVAPIAPEPVNPFTPIRSIGSAGQVPVQPSSTLTSPGTFGSVAPTPVAPTAPTAPPPRVRPPTPPVLQINGKMYQSTDPNAANYVNPNYDWTLNPATGNYVQSTDLYGLGAATKLTVDYYADQNYKLANPVTPEPIKYTEVTAYNTQTGEPYVNQYQTTDRYAQGFIYPEDLAFKQQQAADSYKIYQAAQEQAEQQRIAGEAELARAAANREQQAREYEQKIAEYEEYQQQQAQYTLERQEAARIQAEQQAAITYQAKQEAAFKKANDLQ